MRPMLLLVIAIELVVSFLSDAASRTVHCTVATLVDAQFAKGVSSIQRYDRSDTVSQSIFLK